jgi:hypothetical protein
MTSDESPGPPEMENPPRPARGENGTFRSTFNSRGFDLQARSRCRDCWIEGYLEFIERLRSHSSASPLSSVCAADAMRRYDAFRSSCCPTHRKRAWLAVHKACALLAQPPHQN